MAALTPADGVLVVGTSADPTVCVKRDERDLRAFFPRLIEMPLPDHSSRALLLREFAAVRQGQG